MKEQKINNNIGRKNVFKICDCRCGKFDMQPKINHFTRSNKKTKSH